MAWLLELRVILTPTSSGQHIIPCMTDGVKEYYSSRSSACTWTTPLRYLRSAHTTSSFNILRISIQQSQMTSGVHSCPTAFQPASQNCHPRCINHSQSRPSHMQ